MIKLNLGSVFQFYRRQEIWTILFYNLKDKESRDLKDEYSTLASKMYGIIKVGAIDCGEDEELCEEFQVYSANPPVVKIFTEYAADDGVKHTGKMEWKSISNAAASKMQSFVSVVNKDNYDKFVDQDP